MYVGLIVTALLGWLLSLVMDGLERIAMPWRVEQSSRLQVPVPETIYNWYMATRPLLLHRLDRPGAGRDAAGGLRGPL